VFNNLSEEVIRGIMRAPRIFIAALLIPVALAGLILFDLMGAIGAARSLEVESVQLESLDIDLGWRLRLGIPPVEPYVRAVNMRLSMALSNPTSHELRVRDLAYEIRLNGRPVASGSLEDVRVPPGRSTLVLPVSINPEEAISVVLDALISAMQRGDNNLDFRYEVNGSARIPIKVLGVEIPGFEVRMPFRRDGIYRFSFSIPSLAQTGHLRAEEGVIVERYGWFVGNSEVFSVRPGAIVNAAVLIRARGSLEGELVLEIRRDISFLPDTVATRRAFRVSLRDGEETVLSVEFTAEGGGLMRGYFMRLYYNGAVVWEMGDSYPPRLWVG